ncbi:MAG: type IV pilin protein [Bacillota bacterium]
MLKKMRKMLKNERGLTLVELLAVIVILGIIAAIAVPSIGNIIEKSRADAVKAEGIQALNAAKLYVASEGTPEANTDGDIVITSANIDKYMDKQSDTLTGYTVMVDTTDDNKLKLTATGKKGNVSISFANATVQNINEAESTTGTIPAE